MSSVVTAELVIRNLRVRSLEVDSKEVTWELGDSLAEPLDYTYQVLRSESPSGPFEPLTEPFEERYIFIDRRIPTGDKFVVLYYQLRVTHKRTDKSFTVGPAAQMPEPDLIAQNIRRQEMTYFTQVVGRACWLFKRRVFGPRCMTCWDATLQKRTVDRCRDCYGTGMLRGYHDPIEVWIQIDPAPKAQQNLQPQIAQFVTASARMSYYPIVSPADIIVEAENKRWRVQQVSTTERLRAPIKQELVLRQLEEKDIEYLLPIKLDRALRDIQPSPVRMFDNSTDVNSAFEARTEYALDMWRPYMTEPE